MEGLSIVLALLSVPVHVRHSELAELFSSVVSRALSVLHAAITC